MTRTLLIAILLGVVLSFSVSVTAIADQKMDQKLIEFASEGKLDYVKELIKRGANINGIKGYKSPLCEALRNRHFEVALLLINQGADVNLIVGRDSILGMTVVGASVYKKDSQGYKKVFELLLEKGADINLVSKRGSALSLATAFNNKEYANILLDKNANVNVVDKGHEEWTPLMYAIKNGDFKLVKILLKKGADANGFAPGLQLGSDTPLTLAIKRGNINMVELLLKNGASPNICYRSSSKDSYVKCFPPARQAFSQKQLNCDEKCNIYKLLIKHKANIKQINTKCACYKEIADYLYMYPNDFSKLTVVIPKIDEDSGFVLPLKNTMSTKENASLEKQKGGSISEEEAYWVWKGLVEDPEYRQSLMITRKSIAEERAAYKSNDIKLVKKLERASSENKKKVIKGIKEIYVSLYGWPYMGNIYKSILRGRVRNLYEYLIKRPKWDWCQNLT